jgi:hypothetical protein
MKTQNTATINGKKYTGRKLALAFESGDELNSLDRTITLPCGAIIALSARADKVIIFNFGSFRRQNGAYGSPAVIINL